MMNLKDFEPTVPSVKLFPRLAMSDRSAKSKRSARAISNPHRSGIDRTEVISSQSQVRTRLLRMILENERIRRSEQRPSAS
jgi:hypothetical protein